MIEGLYEFFAVRLNNQRIKFINDVAPNVIIEISLSKIYPVLSNLIYNSMYWVADKEDKKILIHFEKDENALYVEDSGVGISPRITEHIFTPFFSLKTNGRGLGLAISKNVLEAQGHKIEVVLQAPNKLLSGACFKIIFAKEEEN